MQKERHSEMPVCCFKPSALQTHNNHHQLCIELQSSLTAHQQLAQHFDRADGELGARLHALQAAR